VQGWELARDHAMTAVGTDNQMRIWYSDSPALDGGLLFKCALGSVDLENPVGARPAARPPPPGSAPASGRVARFEADQVVACGGGPLSGHAARGRTYNLCG